MAYGLRYFHEFKNNVLDVYRIEIHERDYIGVATDIITTGSPIKIKYQSGEDRPIMPMRASEAEINFFSEEFLSLLDFYTEDDEKYRIDFILKSIFDRDGLQEVYSGDTDVTVTSTAIIIDNQTSQNSIEPGMVIDILGALYEITDAEYNPALNQLAIFVDVPPPAGFYPSEEFTIYEYISTQVNELKWRGFMLQDNSSEEFQDPPYAIQIVATDNLALLKDIAFDVAAEGKYTSFLNLDITMTAPSFGLINNLYRNPLIQLGDKINIDGTNYTVTTFVWVESLNQGQFIIAETIAPGNYTGTYNFTGDLVDKLTIWDYFRICIQATGVALPVRIFNRLYETNHDSTKDMFRQTRLFSGMFLNEDGVWSNCYDILEQILFAFNATLIQADGYWNILRGQELVSRPLTGFAYDENWEAAGTAELDRVFEIKQLTDIYIINADATKSIKRPDKFSRETFNYVQPKQLIKGADLQTVGPFIGSSTAVEVGVNYRYDRYEIPPFWSHQDSAPNATEKDMSYIVVKTNTDENIEIERYIYQPHGNFSFKSLEFEPVPVSAGDIIGFTMSYKNVTNEGSDEARFRVRFLMITAAGRSYNLHLFFPPAGAAPYLRWSMVSTNPATTDSFWKTNIGISKDAPQDATNYNFWDLEEFTTNPGRVKIPGMPEDGMLRIGIQGFIDTNLNLPDPDGQFKDIRFSIGFQLNGSVNAIGHTHTQEQPDIIKNNLDENITIDDSPSSLTAGTLFLNILTGFLTGIGYVYFTKTSLWSTGIKLGEFITEERKQLTKKPRTIIDGTISGMRKGAEFITPISVATIFTLQNLNFIFGVCEFDYYANTFNATLNELYETGESQVDADYEFKYIYETT